jgi:transposase-like protein
LYHAVDQEGRTVDFLLRARRDRKAAMRFLEKAIENNGAPTLVNIDKSGADDAGPAYRNREFDRAEQGLPELRA